MPFSDLLILLSFFDQLIIKTLQGIKDVNDEILSTICGSLWFWQEEPFDVWL